MLVARHPLLRTIVVLVIAGLVLVGPTGLPAARARVTPGDPARVEPTGRADEQPSPTPTNLPRVDVERSVAESPAPTPTRTPTPTAGSSSVEWPVPSTGPRPTVSPVPPEPPLPTVAVPAAPTADLACTGPVRAVTSDPGRDWQDVVVDPVRRLPRDWSPSDLVEIGGMGYAGAPSPRVRRVVARDLRAMHAAAATAKAPFVVTSGFRPESRQRVLWERAVAEEGGAEAARAGTAPPGHSEHQLGTTIDVVDPSLPELVPGLTRTPAGRWLAANAAAYGFVVSYPDGAAGTTCYKPEPWHLRYVGRERAAAMERSRLVPREFLLTRVDNS